MTLDQIGISRRTALSAITTPLLGTGLLPLLTACGGSQRVQPADFTLLATDFTNGVQFIDGTVRTAINASGQVAFVGTELPPPASGQSQAVFVTFKKTLRKVRTQRLGYSDVDAVQISPAGEVAFVANRNTKFGDSFRGVYAADPDVGLGASLRSPVDTVHEVPLPWGAGAPSGPPPQTRLAMAANGRLAYSTLVSSEGGIWRASRARSGLWGTPELLRQGSGIFYNNRDLAINNAGAVPVEMEYGDPYGGLKRGVLIFDTPGDTLASIETVGERAGIGWKPQVAINNLGQVAISNPTEITIQYYSPALPGGGMPTSMQTLPVGVHLATPTAFGLPFSFTTIAQPSDGYENFGKVVVNEAGTVAFEASVGSNSGVFFGPDPMTDTIAITGVNIPVAGINNFFSVVRLGSLNDANQLVIQTSDFLSTDQRIWRVQLPDA